jgi:glycosyltransferase involved in cell wall biosynthesis
MNTAQSRGDGSTVIDKDAEPAAVRLAVSVIVPATDPRPTLPRCVAAIDAALTSGDELVVVKEAPHLGAASARNRGAEEAGNEILVFVDADVEVAPDALNRLRARFATDPELVAVFGSYDDAPEERDVVSTFRNLLHHHVHHGSPGSVDSFWSGLGGVRRAAFEAVGGFDVTIPTSIEDIEFGARLHRHAGRIELDPEIQGKHLKRWSLATMVRTDLRLRGTPWVRLALQGRATTNGLNLAWRHRVSAASCVVMVVSILRRRRSPAAVSLGVLGVLNQRFYRLLAKRGPRYLVSGVCLHVLHHLTSALALVVGVGREIRRRHP